jgi:hypothetical protein
MRRLFGMILILIVMCWCVPASYANGHQQGKARTNGRYVIKNGKRIWVPQGSPATGRYVIRNGKRIWVPQGSPVRRRTPSG